MKLNPIKNDKSTMVDEIIFLIITILVMVVGVLLTIYKPSIMGLNKHIAMNFGIIMVLLGVMYLPCIIYRFCTNDRK